MVRELQITPIYNVLIQKFYRLKKRGHPFGMSSEMNENEVYCYSTLYISKFFCVGIGFLAMAK